MDKRSRQGWHQKEIEPQKMMRFNKIWMELQPFVDERDRVAAKAILYSGLKEFLPSVEEVGHHEAVELERRYASRPKDRPQEVDIEAGAAEVRASWTDGEHAKRSVVDVRRASVLPALPVETRRSVHRSDAS
jgi:hypothetical protein